MTTEGRIALNTHKRMYPHFSIDPLTITLIIAAIKILLPYIIELLKKRHQEINPICFNDTLSTLNWYHRWKIRREYRWIIKDLEAEQSTTFLQEHLTETLIQTGRDDIRILLNDYN